MKIRGTQDTIKPIEVNVDTVYVRINIDRVDTEDFVGWEYDEEQRDKDEFIAIIGELEKENSGLIIENMFLNGRVDDSEKSQADLTLELIMRGVL